jgi:hypothetical protein
MPKHISIHELNVPEDQEAELERYIQEHLRHFQGLEGWTYTLTKGSRGVREGQYAVIIEIDSLENLLRYVPTPGTPSDEMKRVTDVYPDIFDQWIKLVGKNQVGFTGYDVMVEPEKVTP